VFGGSLAFVAGGGAAGALDMDAFANSQVRSLFTMVGGFGRQTFANFLLFFHRHYQLESDTKNCDPSKSTKCIPKLTDDEALCKYGQSGNARAEACKRVKGAGGALPKPGSEGKSLGGAYAM
jgi:hypothetical protein